HLLHHSSARHSSLCFCLFVLFCSVFFFFFQAEDGIRDLYMTGVQTCALPVLFACVTPAIEQFLIDRTALFYTWVGLFVLVVGRFTTSLTGRARRDEMPVFDEPAIEMDQIGRASCSERV